MTIKQQGGIFGRNPTFNDVTVDNDISVTGSITADSATIAGSETSLQSNITISPQDNWNRTLTIKTDEMEFSAPSSFGANYNAKIQFIPSVLKFYTGNGTSVSEAAKFDGSGNLVFPSGQGIDFSATSGTGTSELFSDYEEGSWTPDYSNWTTSPTVYGGWASYTKIGRQVFIQIRGYGGTNNAGIAITNLPFTPSEQPYGTGLAVGTSGEAGFEGTFTASGLVISSNSAPYWWGFSGTYFTS
jgi:hypothetical protein